MGWCHSSAACMGSLRLGTPSCILAVPGSEMRRARRSARVQDRALRSEGWRRGLDERPWAAARAGHQGARRGTCPGHGSNECAHACMHGSRQGQSTVFGMGKALFIKVCDHFSLKDENKLPTGGRKLIASKSATRSWSRAAPVGVPIVENGDGHVVVAVQVALMPGLARVHLQSMARIGHISVRQRIRILAVRWPLLHELLTCVATLLLLLSGEDALRVRTACVIQPAGSRPALVRRCRLCGAILGQCSIA